MLVHVTAALINRADLGALPARSTPGVERAIFDVALGQSTSGAVARREDARLLAYRMVETAWHRQRVCAFDDIAPVAYALTRNPLGLPRVPGGLSVSISHTVSRNSGQMETYAAAVALTTAGAIGIDLELERPLSLPALWLQALTALGLGDPLLGWTLIEALGKADGEGVGRVLEALRPTLDSDRGAVCAAYAAFARARGLAIWHMTANDHGARIAIAVGAEAGEPRPGMPLEIKA